MPLFQKQTNKIKNNQKSSPNFTDWVSVLKCICLVNYSENIQTFDVLNVTVERTHAK